MNERFHTGQARLYDEMDLMKLIRLMRFSRLLAAKNLKMHHWHLIQHFDKYCIKDEEKSSGSDDDQDSDDERQVAFDANDDHYPENTHGNELNDKDYSWYGMPKN